MATDRRIDRHMEFVGSICYCPTTKSRHRVPGDPSYGSMRRDGYTCPGCGLPVPLRVQGDDVVIGGGDA